MAERILNGHFMQITVNGTVIAGAETCSLKITNDIEEVSNKDTGRGKSYIYSRYGATLSSGNIAITGVTETGMGAKTSYDTLLGYVLAGTVIDWEFVDNTSGAVYTKYSGQALVVDAELSNPDFKKVGFTANFTVTGEVTATLID